MKTFLFFIALTISLSVSAQDLLWKTNFTGAGNNIGLKSAIDSKNNVYIIGTFNNTCNLPITLTAKGGVDIFITKYDANGNIQWTRQIGGTSDETPLGIVISPDDEYIYITGIFQQTVYAESSSITSTGSNDGFLAKYKQNGDLVWLKDIASASGNTVQRPAEIKIDKDNHLLIGGLFESELKLGTSIKDTTLNTTQVCGMFFAKLDTSGTLIKAKKLEASHAASRLYTFDTDNSGYYLTGHFNGNLITDLGTYTSSNSSLDMFVFKLDFNLESKWIMKAAGTGSDQLYSCSVDNQGYFYVGGHFASNILVVDSLPNGTLSKKTGINKTTNGKNDIFFAKFKHDGTLQWFNTAGSTENDYLYRANFQNGYFIAAGQYGASLTFRNKTITPFNTADAFAIIHTSSNNLVGLVSIGGTGNETGETALIDKNNDAIVMGDYSSSKIFFTPTDSLVNSNSGTRDMFVAKYHLILLNIEQEVEIKNPYKFKSTVTVDSLLTADSISTKIARVDTLKFNDGTKMSTAANVKYFNGDLTDDAPTAAQISFITGMSPSSSGSSVNIIIKDTSGSGKYYEVRSDGTNWIWFPGKVGTIAN